ncbi:MAG: hypothetical protein ACI4P3_01190, partial [Candidatus Spyradosoma sp.]
MKSSKILITSLLAAAAMSAAPAWATVEVGEVQSWTWDNVTTGYDTDTQSNLKRDLGQFYFKSGGNIEGNDIVIGGTTEADSAKGLVITDANGGTYTLSGSVTGTGILAIRASSGYGTNQLIFSGDVSGFSGKFYVNTGSAHTLKFSGSSTTALSGTGTIETNKTLVYEKGAGATYTIANSSITAKTLQFTGGANYTVSSTVTGQDSTASNNTLTISAGTQNSPVSTTFTNTVSNFGTISVGNYATGTISSAYTNSGTLTKTGAGTLVFGNSANISNLTISDGIVQINNA